MVSFGPMSVVIDYDEYLEATPVERMHRWGDDLLNIEVENTHNLKFLGIREDYTPHLSRLKDRIIRYYDIPPKFLVAENKLIRMVSIDGTFSKNEFVEAFETAQNMEDIKYMGNIRDVLLSLGMIEASSPIEGSLRPEFAGLKEALEVNDLDLIFKYTMRTRPRDITDYTDEEKSLLLEVCKINGYAMAMAVSGPIQDSSVNASSWKEFWETVSDYDQDGVYENLRENNLLNQKRILAKRDKAILDMTMFPNLPQDFNEESVTFDSFVESINWSKDLEPFEKDFLWSISIAVSDENRDRFVSTLKAM